MASDLEKCAFLSEHLFYELLMLRYTRMQVQKPQDQLTWNAMYELFAVHARNLFVFLKSSDTKNNDNMRANHFVDDFKIIVPDKMGSVAASLNPHILHLGKIRRDADRKPHIDRLGELFVWLEESINLFGAKLPPKFEKHWRPEAADPAIGYYGATPYEQITQSSISGTVTFGVTYPVVKKTD